jgi:ABC-type spermidine/putrescine transport system permease subunit I
LVFSWLCIFARGNIENNLESSEITQKPFKWILTLLLFIFMLSIYLFDSYEHLKDYFGDEK